LRLNANWVVLSACNTIAGDKPGAEALSGLARSFFYAVARALLVSHGAVDSAAATRLTVATFDRLKSDPKLGRAEALRQAMLGYLNDASSPRNAYPAVWGPFALIGEGAARQVGSVHRSIKVTDANLRRLRLLVALWMARASRATCRSGPRCSKR